MRVALAGRTVRRPAGVGDADISAQRRGSQRVRESAHLAEHAPPVQALVVTADDREPCGVVPPVFEAQQALDQDGRDAAPRDGAYDSAHSSGPSIVV